MFLLLLVIITAKGAITSKIKHAIKLKTSPASLAQLLQPLLAFCFSLQPMTAYRPGLDGTPSLCNSCESLAGLVLCLLHVLFYLWSLSKHRRAVELLVAALQLRWNSVIGSSVNRTIITRCVWPCRGTILGSGRQLTAKTNICDSFVREKVLDIFIVIGYSLL